MRNEEGAASLELVLTIPALVAVMMFVVLCGRMVTAQMDVDAVSRDAARAAAAGRTADASNARAQAVVDQMTSDGRCRSATAGTQRIGTSTQGSVVVTVQCTVRLGDLALLAVPASKTFSSRFVEPLDVYRGA